MAKTDEVNMLVGAEYMKSKPPNSESKILYLRPFKAYNMLRIF